MASPFPFTLDVSGNFPNKDFTTDVTLIIAHRGPAIGLWATIESAEIQLRNSGLKYNYVIVHNGDEATDIELATMRVHLNNSGKLLDWFHHSTPLSPPGARQLGSESADGKYLFFLDNHCVVGQNYFTQAVQTFEETGADMIHSLTRFYIGEKDHFHYELDLKRNFWAKANFDGPGNDKPYRIAAGGHGGFAVRRSVWEELGGYGPITLFDGYAGEEIYFDLKMALHDKTNWLDPKMIHHHWSGVRPYDRHFSDGYFQNLMQCAYMIGGQEWVDRVYRSFRANTKKSPVPMYRLYESAIRRGQSEKKKIDQTRLRSLDEQLEEFKRLGIPH